MSSKRALRAGALCLAALCLALLATGSAAPAADAGRSASGSELRSVAMPEGPGALHRAYIDAGGEFRPDELLTRGELAQFIYRAYGPLELGEFFADGAVQHFPEVFLIAEDIGQSDRGDFRDARLEYGGRGFGEIDLAVLRLLETLGFGADHAGGVDLDLQFAAGEFREPFGHVHHRFMDGVVGRESVTEFQDAGAAVVPLLARAHMIREPQRNEQQRKQDSADDPGSPFGKHLRHSSSISSSEFELQKEFTYTVQW